MKFFLQKHMNSLKYSLHKPFCIVTAVIQQEDYTGFLSQEEKNLIAGSCHGRMMEFSAGRAAAKTAVHYLCGDFQNPAEFSVKYDADGAPFVQNVPFVSISHSNHIAAAVCAEEAVGIDVHTLSAMAYDVRDGYLSPKEIHLTEHSGNRIFAFSAAWCAKESMSKIIRKGLAVMKHIRLDCFSPYLDNLRIKMHYHQYSCTAWIWHTGNEIFSFCTTDSAGKQFRHEISALISDLHGG